MNKFNYVLSNNMSIEVVIRRSKKRKKTMEITFPSSQEILIKVPFNTKKIDVEQLISAREKQVIQHLNSAHAMEINKKQIKYSVGEELLYIGYPYELDIILDDKLNVELRDRKIVVTTYNGTQEAIKSILEHWYKVKGQIVIEDRVKKYSKYFTNEPRLVKVKEQKRIWGSCNSKRELRFNWRLIKAPIEIIDYVVVHELCHMVHMNHSKNFWGTVEKIVPDYRERRKWLKENGSKLMW